MQDLKETSPGGLGIKPHTHVAFVDSNEGGGLTSVDENHSHQIIYQPPVPANPGAEAVIDPETGEELSPAMPPTEAQPEQWIIEPSEDGHTHEGLFEIERKVKQKRPEDSEIVGEVHDFLRANLEIEGESYDKAEESEDFYKGKQWSVADKAYLKDRDRASLTINDTAKEINKLSGHQRQARTDFKVVPVGGTQQGACDILNIILKNIAEQCYYEREEAKAFLDGIIRGRGWFNLYVDKMKNPQGDIIIERFNPRNVRVGQHEKEDLSDAEYLTKERMYSLARLQGMYDEKADDLESIFTGRSAAGGSVSEVHEDSSEDAYSDSNANEIFPASMTSIVGGEIKLVDSRKKELLLIELWKRLFVKVPVIVNQSHDFYFDGFGIPPAKIKAVKTIPGFVVVDRVVNKMAISRVVGNVVLEYHSPAILPVDEFFVVPFYCNKRDNDYWGKVEDIKDPQREVNKRHSQIVDIGNKCTGYGWWYDATTFPLPKDEEDFKKNVSSSGFTIKVADIQAPPKEHVGGEIPAVLSQLLTLSHQSIAELMNITVNPNGANESNAMFQYRQKLLFAGNEYVFDNLKFAKIQLGRLVIAMVQDTYTAERIWKLLIDEDSRLRSEEPAPGEEATGVMIEGQPLSQYQEEDVHKILEDNDLTKTQVVVTEGVYSPSVRQAIFAVLADLKQAGADVPLELMFEFADLPKEVKNKILKVLADSAAAATEEGNKKNATELLKSMMGKGGGIPPQFSQKISEIIGVDPSGGNGATMNNTQPIGQ